MSDFDPTGLLGEIRLFAGTVAPRNWAMCDGSVLKIVFFEDLYRVIGSTYGGDGETTVGLPDLRGRAPMHIGSGPGLTPRALAETGGTEQAGLSAEQMPKHSHVLSAVPAPATDREPRVSSFMAQSDQNIYAPGGANAVAMAPASIATVGSGAPHENMQPYVSVSFIIATIGQFPFRNEYSFSPADPYTGEIRMFAGDYVPTNGPGSWWPCDGQILRIASVPGLFDVIGTTYGGDGHETFALPNLQGRIPIGAADAHPLGEAGGSATVTLTIDNLPGHSHALNAASGPGVSERAAGNMLASSTGGDLYAPATSKLTAMSPGALSRAGGGEPHNNMQPYLPVTFMICYAGSDPRL